MIIYQAHPHVLSRQSPSTVSSRKLVQGSTCRKERGLKALDCSLLYHGATAVQDTPQATTEKPINMAGLAAKPQLPHLLEKQPGLHQSGWCDVGSSAPRDSGTTCNEVELSQHRRACSAARRLALERPTIPASLTVPLSGSQGETRLGELPCVVQPRPMRTF